MRKLLEPNTRAIGRPPGPPTCDALPDSLIDGTPSEIRDDLVRFLGRKQVLHRVIDLVRYASDASPYRLLPKVVVMPRDVTDIANILDQRHEGRARCPARRRLHFGEPNLRNRPSACDRAPLPIICLPARGIDSTGTVARDCRRPGYQGVIIGPPVMDRVEAGMDMAPGKDAQATSEAANTGAEKKKTPAIRTPAIIVGGPP